jgi:hypothetical protein
MPTVACPSCKTKTTLSSSDFRGTFQCSECAAVLRVVIAHGITTDVRLRAIDLDIPAGLPADLDRVLAEAIRCAEIEVHAAAVVLTGLFVEGLLRSAGMKGTRLVDMITHAHKAGIISDLGLNLATASRYLRNIGAHYSPDLAKLSSSDARLVLEIARKLAADVVDSGKLADAT